MTERAIIVRKLIDKYGSKEAAEKAGENWFKERKVRVEGHVIQAAGCAQRLGWGLVFFYSDQPAALKPGE